MIQAKVAARPRRARKQPAEVRREEILAAATRVFARTSYAAAGTAEIAREAGIAEPTIYRHFGSKRELYVAALHECKDSICRSFRAIASETENALEALMGIGKWYEHNIVSNPDPVRMRVRSMSESLDPEVRETLHQDYQEIIAIITEVIQRGQAQGVFTKDIPAEGGALLFCAVGQQLDCMGIMGVDEGTRLAQADALAATAMRALLTNTDDIRKFTW
jgi:AcrR family transcriptional regulator